MLSKISDEVYDGLRCAVCELRFGPGETARMVSGTGERIHDECPPLREDLAGVLIRTLRERISLEALRITLIGDSEEGANR